MEPVFQIPEGTTAREILKALDAWAGWVRYTPTHYEPHYLWDFLAGTVRGPDFGGLHPLVNRRNGDEYYDRTLTIKRETTAHLRALIPNLAYRTVVHKVCDPVAFDDAATRLQNEMYTRMPGSKYTEEADELYNRFGHFSHHIRSARDAAAYMGMWPEARSYVP